MVDFPGVATSGGTLVVGGQSVVVPAHTMVTMPAALFTWQELFALAPAPYGGTVSGLALQDVPKPDVTFQARVVGNTVVSRRKKKKAQRTDTRTRMRRHRD